MELATGISTEATTQAIASLRVAVGGFLIAGGLAAIFASRLPEVVLLPALVINMGFLQITPLHGLLFSIIQFPWMYAWSYPLRLALGLPPVFSYLFTYTPIVIILARSRPDRHGLLGSFFIRYVWDPPLLTAIFLTAWTGLDGGRLMSPFLSYIDDVIVIGSMPLKKDAKVLAEDHNVGAVINMTAEYEGPVEEYELLGIRQLRLPTVDTTCPSFDAVSKGVTFIKEFVKTNPSKRVFIHCKGGRGRAAVMAAAYYCATSKREPKEVVGMLKAKRPVVSSAVAKYETLIRLHQTVTTE